MIERDVPAVLEREIDEGPEESSPPAKLPAADPIASERVIDVDLRGQPW